MVRYLIRSLIPYEVGLELLYLMRVDWKLLDMLCKGLKTFGLIFYLFLLLCLIELLHFVEDFCGKGNKQEWLGKPYVFIKK